MSIVTRNKKPQIYLLGTEESELKGSKLPSNKQVLCVLLYHLRKLKKTLRESSRAVIRETVKFWVKARIPVKDEGRAIIQLETLYDKWVKLKKSSKRRTETQGLNEKLFVEEFDNLFDIAHANALETIALKEDKEFLLAQREKGRRGCMSGEDKKLYNRECKAEERRQAHLKRKLREQERKKLVTNTATTELSSSEDEIAESVVTTSPAASPNPQKRGRKNIITSHLAATLDRINISDRKATFVLTAAAQSLGKDPKEFTVNRSSIRRDRARAREDIATKLKEQFSVLGPLIVHWDGKLLKDLTGKDMVDRLPVIVSGSGQDQLLGVPKLEKGTGRAQAEAVTSLIKEWDLADKIKGLCFDTTATNSGSKNGACTLLEINLEKNLLHFACRHHILELVLASVFTLCLGASSGPDVSMFKRFQAAWEKMDHTRFEPGIKDEVILNSVKEEEVDSIIAFCSLQLQVQHPRDDYREFLELAVVFLGGIPPRGIRFMAPGALHNARWMAKCLYCLKMWMFKDQFHLTRFETQGIRDVCLFVVRVYIKAWFTAPLRAESPNNDLEFLKLLVKYETENQAVSNAAVRKFGGHLWYLSEELVGLAFFDLKVSLDSKRSMVKALNEKEGFNDPPLKRTKLADIKTCLDMSIDNFVTKNTMAFFDILGIPITFLEVDPSSWNESEDYKNGESIVRNLRVVNDNAERGVALMEQYNATITKDEEQKQFLLQVVQDHRRNFQDCNKATLSKVPNY